MKRSVVTVASLILGVGMFACNGLLGITQLDGDAGVPSDASARDTAESDAPPDDGPAEADHACDDLPDAGPGPACFPRPRGLVSWWRAEGNADDSAGPNNGTLTNTTYVPGYVGQAFHFTGDGYVKAAALTLPLGADDRAMEAWVRPTVRYPNSVSKQGLFFGYGAWGTYGGLSALLDCPTGAGNTILFTQWGEQVFGGVLEPDVWHHVAMTLAGGDVSVYLDGSLVGTLQLGGVINTAPGGTSYLGGLPSPPAADISWLFGDVDEAAVYSRALCPQEIAGIVAAGSLGKCP